MSVNAALDGLPALEGQDVTIEGILHFEFEHVSLDHFPKSERAKRSDDAPNASSIWLETGSGSLQFNESALERLSGKRVLVEGTLHRASGGFGMGHFSMWSAAIQARTIERLT
jgi:hypothetical protein